jgi:hypothetical protein
MCARRAVCRSDLLLLENVPTGTAKEPGESEFEQTDVCMHVCQFESSCWCGSWVHRPSFTRVSLCSPSFIDSLTRFKLIVTFLHFLTRFRLIFTLLHSLYHSFRLILTLHHSLSHSFQADVHPPSLSLSNLFQAECHPPSLTLSLVSG